jgi:hypothetical protein
LEHEAEECLLLLKLIYGFVQPARQFFKKFVSILGFVPSDADPCLMIRKYNLGLVYIAMYIDNCYCNINEAVITDSIKGIFRNGLNVTVKNDLEDHLTPVLINTKKCTSAQHYTAGCAVSIFILVKRNCKRIAQRTLILSK